MAKTVEQLELDTVKAVTEMRGDIRLLTTEVKRLNDTITRMTENYVTKEDHIVDITNLSQKLEEAKTAGRTRTVLVGLLTALISSLLTYEVINLVTK